MIKEWTRNAPSVQFFPSIHTFINRSLPHLSSLVFPLSLVSPSLVLFSSHASHDFSPHLEWDHSLTHSLAELVLRPLASVSPARMGRAPGFVIVGFAEHEPVFTMD